MGLSFEREDYYDGERAKLQLRFADSLSESEREHLKMAWNKLMNEFMSEGGNFLELTSDGMSIDSLERDRIRLRTQRIVYRAALAIILISALVWMVVIIFR